MAVCEQPFELFVTWLFDVVNDVEMASLLCVNSIVDNVPHRVELNIAYRMDHNIVRRVQHNIPHEGQHNIVHLVQHNIVHM